MRRTETTLMADAGYTARQIQVMGNWRSTTVPERDINHSHPALQVYAKVITTPRGCCRWPEFFKCRNNKPWCNRKKWNNAPCQATKCQVSFFGPVHQVLVSIMSKNPLNPDYSRSHPFTDSTKDSSDHRARPEMCNHLKCPFSLYATRFNLFLPFFLMIPIPHFMSGCGHERLTSKCPDACVLQIAGAFCCLSQQEKAYVE